MPPEKLHWSHLYQEVVTSGLCTGCSACVVVCPYDVLGYNDKDGVYRPFHVPEMGGTDNCTHGEKGCTLCTRACPRFRSWEPEIDTFLFGREHEDDGGIRHRPRRDPRPGHRPGGLLGRSGRRPCLGAVDLGARARRHRCRSRLEPRGGRHDLEGGAGRRPRPSRGDRRGRLALHLLGQPAAPTHEAIEGGAERIALVGMGCQASAPAIMSARKAGKVARRFVLTIGLLCSKTFDDAIFPELFEARYGLAREDIVKMNIKGIFQVWTHDGELHEVPLKEAHEWTREGCKHCPDFAAEHADISTGGIGAFPDWTLTMVRTDKGRELISADARGRSDRGALGFRRRSRRGRAVRKLSRVSRRRWPRTPNRLREGFRSRAPEQLRRKALGARAAACRTSPR